jgi:hypothetical protein
MVREFGVLFKAFSLLPIVPTVLFIGFLNRPLRRAPVNRRYEIILSRRYKVACLFSGPGPLFPSRSLRLELYGYLSANFFTR